MRKTVLALALATLMISVATAASNEPSHPLSHIHPTDIDLNMTGNDIFNVSELRLRSGFLITNYEFRDDTNTRVLLYNTSADKWEVVSSDLDLNDNSVQNFFAGSCSAGKAVGRVYPNGSYQCVNLTQSLNDRWVDESGDVMTGDLNLSGNDLIDPGNITSFFAPACSGADEVVKGVFPNGSYTCVDASTLGSTEDLQTTLGAGNWTGGIDINMTGSSLLDFFGSACGTDEAVKRVYPNGTFLCTSTIDTGQDVENLNMTLEAGNLANQSIFMTGNDINGIGTLNTGGQSFSIGASVNMSFNNINQPANINDYFQSSVCPSGQVVDGINADGSYQCVDVDEGSTVENLSTTLNAGNEAFNSINFTFTGNITNINRIEDFFASACGSGQVVEQVNPDGTYSCVDPSEDIQTEDLNQTLLAGNLANMSIKMTGNNVSGLGSLHFQDGSVRAGDSDTTALTSSSVAIGSNARVTSGGGSIALGANSWVNNRGAFISTSAMALGYLSYAHGNSAIALGRSANASAPNAVAIGGYAKAPNPYEATFGNLGSQKLDVNVTGNLTVHGLEGLTFASSNPNINNFFDTSTCPSGQVVDSVNADGSYDCVDVDEGSTVENLSTTLNAGNKAFDNINLTGSDITNVANIRDFFANTCSGSNEVVKRVYPNGTYVCQTVPEDTGVENLAETLSAGNFADGTDIYMNGSASVLFPNGVEVGNSGTFAFGASDIAIGNDAFADDIDTTSDTRNVLAIGSSANASDFESIAIGPGSAASNSFSLAVGEGSTASGSSSIALGSGGEASGSDAIVLGGDIATGSDSVSLGSQSVANATGAIVLGNNADGDNIVAEATAESAVAIGTDAIAPNSYEATFGSLTPSDRLDVNVTGNTTIHGLGGVRMPNGIVIGDGLTSTGAASEIAIGQGASAAGSSSQPAIAIGESSDASGVDTIAIGRSASANVAGGIAVGESASTGDGSSIAIGDGASSSPQRGVTLGPSTSVTVYQGVAIGASASSTADSALAIGAGSSADAQSAVAIGENAVSPASYEATFGNLGSEKMDVNVTGNLTVHGEFVDLPNGAEVRGVVSNSGDDAVNRSFVLNNGSVGTDDQTLAEVLTEGDEANGQRIVEIGSGLTNITSTGAIEAGADIDLKGNNLANVNEISGDSAPVQVANDVEMTGASPKIDMGNGMSVQRVGGDMVISD